MRLPFAPAGPGRASPLVAAVVAGALLGGCATSLSSFQPAHVPARGHLAVEVGSDVSIPTGTFARTVDVGKTLARAARERTLTEAEKLQVFAAGTNLTLNPPSLVEHVGVTYAPADGWEIGVRYAAQAWRLGGRRQLLHQDGDGYDLTVGLGVQRFSFGFPLDDVIDIISLDDFTRWNVDLPVAIGRRSDFFRWWAGPRLVLSSFSARLALRAPGTAGAAASTDVASVEGTGGYLGAQAGAAVGWRFLFLAAELTVVRMVGSAHIDVFGRRTQADTGTFIVYPGLAVLGEF